MKINYQIVALIGLVMLAVVGCTPAAPVLADQSDLQGARDESKTTEVLTFDVAEDPTRFVFDPDMVQETGFPVHGNPFITQGYIYPAGTLDDSDGINDDGSPEFPDKVIGTWTCRGWVLGDITNSAGKPAAISTQVFQLGEVYGSQTIISDGYEFIQAGATWTRAIVGGSGEYVGVRGEQTQEILGINEDMAMAHRIELRLR